MSFKTNFSMVKPDKCHRCDKTVYCAEKIIGAGEVIIYFYYKSKNGQIFKIKLSCFCLWNTS